MRDRLSGQIALVTGATGGIGDAVSRRLAAEGAAVVVTDVDMRPLRRDGEGADGRMGRERSASHWTSAMRPRGATRSSGWSPNWAA